MDKLVLAKRMVSRIKEFLPDVTIVNVYQWLQNTNKDETFEQELRSYISTAKEIKPGEMINGKRIPQDLNTNTAQEIQRYIMQGGKMLLIEFHTPNGGFTRIFQYHDLNGEPITSLDRLNELKERFITDLIMPYLVEKLVDEYLQEQLNGGNE